MPTQLSTVSLIALAGSPPIPTPLAFYAEFDGTAWVLCSQPFVDGAAVSATNTHPMPTVDAGANASLTTLLDDQGTIITALEGIETSSAATASGQSAIVTLLGEIEASGAASATAAGQTTGNNSLATITTTLENNGTAQATAALQTAGNASTALTAAALGTPADAAWSGSGSSTIVAALKAIWAALTGTLKTSTTPGIRTLVPLDITTVTTGGTAVTALIAGHRSAGGWIRNPESATVNLGINEIGTASGTSSSGNTTFIAPGQSYVLAPTGGAVSIISTDSAHPFSGMGFQ